MSKRKMLKQLASKGRMGDTELRRVKGRLSHVNPMEAKIIDRAGKKGEDFVTKIGSGTINPKTGLKEYNDSSTSAWQAVSAIGGGLSGLAGIASTIIGASQAKKNLEHSNQCVGVQKRARLMLKDLLVKCLSQSTNRVKPKRH